MLRLAASTQLALPFRAKDNTDYEQDTHMVGRPAQVGCGRASTQFVFDRSREDRRRVPVPGKRAGEAVVRSRVQRLEEEVCWTSRPSPIIIKHCVKIMLLLARIAESSKEQIPW